MPNGRQGDGSPEEMGRLLPADSDDTPRSARRAEVKRRRRRAYERVSTVGSEAADADADVGDVVEPITAPEVDEPPIDGRSKADAAVEDRASSGDRPVARPGGGTGDDDDEAPVDRGRHGAARVKVVYYQNRFVALNIDRATESAARQSPSQSSGSRSPATAPTPATAAVTTTTTATATTTTTTALAPAGQPSTGPSAGDDAGQIDPTGGGTVASTISPRRGRDTAAGSGSDETGRNGDQRDTVSGPPPQPQHQQQQQQQPSTERAASRRPEAASDAPNMQPVPGTSSMGEPLAPMGSLSAIPGVMTLGTPTPGPGPGPGPGAQQPPVKKIRRKKKDSIFAKIARVLEDDRVKRGDKDMTMKLRTVNRLQDASELQILKKILNIIFLITGAALLLGVIVVIVYTAVSTSCPMLKEPENGYTMPGSCGVSVKSVCHFRCNSGFRLEGSETRVCQNDSSWSGREAVCVYTGEYPPELEIKDYVEYYHIPEMPTDIHVMSIDEADGDERFEDFVKPIDNIPPEEGATDDRKEWPIFESVDPAVDYDDPAVDPTPDRRRPDPGGERRPDADPPDPADPETPETPENDYTFFEPKELPDLYAADGYT